MQRNMPQLVAEEITQVPTGDPGFTRDLCVLLVSLIHAWWHTTADADLAQRARGVHEGRAAAQDPQHPVHACEPVAGSGAHDGSHAHSLITGEGYTGVVRPVVGHLVRCTSRGGRDAEHTSHPAELVDGPEDPGWLPSPFCVSTNVTDSFPPAGRYVCEAEVRTAASRQESW